MPRQIRLVIPSLLAINLLFGSATAQTQDQYVALKDMPVSIVPPADFAPVGDGISFRHGDINAVIEASRVPAPYAEVIPVFTAEEMSKRGMRLVSKDNVTADDRAALLLKVEESGNDAGIARWTLVLGDYQETILINATYPKKEENSVSAAMRTALLSARWSKRAGEDPFVNFRFEVSPTPKLAFAKEMDTLLAFTADGTFPMKAPGDPLLLTGYAINEERIADERAFAREAFQRIPECEKTAIKETNAITLSGLQGYETVGSGIHSETGTKLEIYQLLLFADGYHLFVLGRVDETRADEYMAEFKATARTFKMK